jgi:hypothetical protein
MRISITLLEILSGPILNRFHHIQIIIQDAFSTPQECLKLSKRSAHPLLPFQAHQGHKADNHSTIEQKGIQYRICPCRCCYRRCANFRDRSKATDEDTTSQTKGSNRSTSRENHRCTDQKVLEERRGYTPDTERYGS